MAFETRGGGLTMKQGATGRVHELRFETHKTDDETKIVCAGKINSDTTVLLKSVVQPYIPGCKRLVLDLSQVEYVDSSGMGALVALWVSAKRASCEFRVVSLNERIKDLLRISQLSKILEGDQEYHKYLPM
jgi:anti-sigma B factor antagonist